MMRRLCPRRLGSIVHANARRLVSLIALALLILSAANNSAKLDVDLSNWIQRTTRIESELKAIETAVGDGAGSNSLLILQTPKKRHDDHDDHQGQNNIGVLSVESIMIHLEALAIATHVTIDMFDVSWSLKDICFAPTPPDYEGLLVNQMLDHLMPCVIKTPLDCFWEGSKLLGPEQDVRLSSIGPKLKWTSLNPVAMIEATQSAHPHASFPYQTLLDWMRRVGIVDGYLKRPCLDPSDPNCPLSAPNKQSGEPPNIGLALKGGCHGLATKQMHWREEELLGGVTKNKSGHIVGAEALQSTVLLMGERDVYDYWRKTSKVQDISNWSVDKAKLILDSWQRRFREELVQFTRSSVASNSFKIHALTPRSMLETIENDTVLDSTNFRIAAIFMTIFTCLNFPSFRKSDSNLNTKTDSSQDYHKTHLKDVQTDAGKNEGHQEDDTDHIDRFRITILALIISITVILTFIASLGLSSFINLPFNMATTQILPPLSLFYGFRQALMIANTYSYYYKRTSSDDLTIECLMELMPIIVIECTTFIIPLIVATAFPIQAARVFTLQAISYIILSTLTSILFIPSLLTIFLTESNKAKQEELVEVQWSGSDRSRSRSRSTSPGILSITSRRSAKSKNQKVSLSINEEIFSRLQNDLRNIKNSPQQRSSADINISGRLGSQGTSFSLSTVAHDSMNDFDCYHRADSGLSQTVTPEPTFGLPDLLQPFDNRPRNPNKQLNDGQPEKNSETDKRPEDFHDINENMQASEPNDTTENLSRNRIFQLVVVLLKLAVFVAILSQAQKVKFGLQLTDIVLRGTNDYESFMIREKYFPVYNIFAITKSGLDYPSNQKLLYELHKKIGKVDGVLKSETTEKFWLIYFRDWLIELQENFDHERNRSAISKEGWNEDASDTSKLAYKLLAQTGKLDNPIDKNLVETSRLVDKNGIINQRAFYYYLTAWVMNDAFTYSNSEANFRPEPRVWNENPNDLRIERARPLTYAQMPFVIRLPEGRDNMQAISEIRTISQQFEHLNLPNFPTGIPFIFWDQFFNLDYLFYTATSMIVAVLFLLIGLAFGDLIMATILIAPTILNMVEVHCVLGYLSIPFNSVVGVLLVSVVGILTIQTLQIAKCFVNSEGNVKARVDESRRRSSRTEISGLVLLGTTSMVFYSSSIDFMTKYSWILISLTLMSAFNSRLLTPSLLSLLGSDNPVEDHQIGGALNRSPLKSPRKSVRTTIKNDSLKRYKFCRKKRGYPRVPSQVSLSTIAEEPQSEAPAHDLKINFSIRC